MHNLILKSVLQKSLSQKVTYNLSMLMRINNNFKFS